MSPSELEITAEQLKRIEELLDIEFPVGLEYYIGVSAD
ncbi:pyocin S6 family toxin immunity protein [Pseudomonas sp. Z4-20]